MNWYQCLSGAQRNNGKRYRYTILLAAALAVTPALAAVPQAQPEPSPFRVEEATIASVHAAMQRGTLSCHELVEDYLLRIQEYDKNGPAVNSIVLVNPKVLSEADAIDQRRKKGESLGSLYCVPMIVKGNYETIGMQSAAGSLSLKGYVSNRNAFVVGKLLAAGALILAKGNMEEFAWSGDQTLSSILPGYTRNPYDTSRTTGGSSGGPAAAVAANFGLVGLGTDTGSSIRGPASFDDSVGVRPTLGLTSRSGVVPLNLMADTTGPITRTVQDAAAVLQVMAGPDPSDPATAPSAAHMPVDYVAALRQNALKGARIGVLRQAWTAKTVDPEIMSIFHRALDQMKKAGATIVNPPMIPDFKDLRKPPKGAYHCEGFKYTIDRYLKSRGNLVPLHSLAEIIKSGRVHHSNDLPGMLAPLKKAESVKHINGPDSAACQADIAYRKKVGNAVVALMDRLKLNALVYPTWTNEPRLLGDLNTPEGNNNRFFGPTTGFPVVQVPMGFTRGETLPAGLSLYGRPWSEAELLSLAYSFQQHTNYRRPPSAEPPLRTTQGLRAALHETINSPESTGGDN
jgi:Asp-tRNA(Asn)/Glu-tRNA(Gln) amidotransferase A subunit family amidase